METSFEGAACEYYSHHGAGTIDEYVESAFLNNPLESERIQHIIDTIPADAQSVLDVGAGFGVLLHQLLKSRDVRAKGLEMAQTCISWGLERGLDLQVGSAHELPFEDKSFDVITCCEVLEHLDWGVYEAALEEFARVAGRWILISVPYDERRNFARCPYCGSSSNPHYHFRSFAPGDLEGLFPGFELEEVDTVGQISVLTLLKPYLPTPWDARMICPACNYRAQSKAAAKKTERLVRFKRFLREVPLPTRPRWLVGLFRRSSC